MKKLTEVEVRNTLNKKFIKCDDFARVLWMGYTENKNAIFWGPGGHAKSEMAKEFFDANKIPVFIQALGDGTTEDNLLGGLNMKVFKDEGKIEYLVENSFMNHEYVIFEELLDCPSQVLLRLKDILTSGMFRNGTQQFTIKTKYIVCLTNRSREEVSEDRSVLALMERFPLEYHVVWDSYEAKDYVQMFRKVLGKDYTMLAEAIARCNKGSFISPRTAIHAAHIFTLAGFKGLANIAGFNPDIIKDLMANEDKMKKEVEMKEFLSEALNYSNSLIKKANTCKTVGEYLEIVATIEELNTRLSTTSVTDKNTPHLKSILDLLKQEATTLSAKALENVKPNQEELVNIGNLMNRSYDKINITGYTKDPATS